MYLTPHRNNLGIINNCSSYSVLCIPNVSIYSYMGSTGFTKTIKKVDFKFHNIIGDRSLLIYTVLLS